MNYLIGFILLLTTGAVSAENFDISGIHQQSIQLDGANTINIECYCPIREVQTSNTENTIKLLIEARYSSVGYHGKQTIPTSIKPKQMQFQVDYSKNTLKLISQEWAFMHHLFEVEQLKVIAPDSISVNFIDLSYGDLEGRKKKLIDSQ